MSYMGNVLRLNRAYGGPESGRGQPHSKTLSRVIELGDSARFWSAAVLCRFGFCRRIALMPQRFNDSKVSTLFCHFALSIAAFTAASVTALSAWLESF